MLRPRIIPSLLVHNKGLVKTVKFKDPKYVGDPLNAVKIFNEKEVDELVVFDIDATAENRSPDFTLIKNLAAECRMPLCYGGGVSTVEHAKKIISLGAEKVALSAAAIRNPAIVTQIADAVGVQSVVVVLDVKKTGFLSKYEVFITNGKVGTSKNPVELAQSFEKLGAGEIVINNIDNDGMMQGYDLKLVQKIRESITTPITVLGGAGSLENLEELVEKSGVIGAAAGSLFVFKGKYRAVLINYPTKEEKSKIYSKN
jgi:imidazole glycerol-phosphate synthase subunit HisF